MTQARKIIKVPNGDAFIEIAESYIRFGVGDKTFFILDDKTITAGGDAMNWQMAPNKITYQGFLSNVGPIAGIVSGTYKLDKTVIQAMVNASLAMASISSAVGI
jgi:hypothetical protein